MRETKKGNGVLLFCLCFRSNETVLICLIYQIYSFRFRFVKFISYFLTIFYILTNLIGNEFLVERREKRFLRQQVLFFECFYQAWLQNQATRISSLHRVVLEQRSSIIYRYIFNKRYTYIVIVSNDSSQYSDNFLPYYFFCSLFFSF